MSNNFLYRERLRIPNDNKNTYAIEIISLRNRLEQHRVQWFCVIRLVVEITRL